jgi:hypothetical protein
MRLVKLEASIYRDGYAVRFLEWTRLHVGERFGAK